MWLNPQTDARTFHLCGVWERLGESVFGYLFSLEEQSQPHPDPNPQLSRQSYVLFCREPTAGLHCWAPIAAFCLELCTLSDALGPVLGSPGPRLLCIPKAVQRLHTAGTAAPTLKNQVLKIIH